MSVDILEVRQALRIDEMLPCFQPLVEIRTGRLAGFEVLARWIHPEQGLVLPADFIRLAEQDNLIGSVMERILSKAFLAVPALPKHLKLAVNVSPMQLRDSGLPDQIKRAAEETGFPLTQLTIEITESGLLDNLDQARRIATRLKDMGCHLSLDDFGTGYSSLSHLQALPFDELKIDRSFISSMTRTRESRKIVAAIIGLAHSLGRITVAEGVETEEQADMLLWLGCEIGQGWLYGRPVTSDKIPGVIASPRRVPPADPPSHGDGWATSSLEALPTQRLAQLQAIYDGAPVGLCFLDCDMRYVSLNQRMASMNNIPVAAHLGKTIKEMIPAMFPLYEPYLTRSLKGEAIEGVELTRLADEDAGLSGITGLASFQPAWDEADEVIGVSIAIIDITEKKNTEEALRESDVHLRELITQKNQVSWVMDPMGNHLKPSSSWVRMTDINMKRTRNLGWLEALHEDDLQPTLKVMQHALRTGEPIDITYRIKNVDGEWTWMHSCGSPRYGAEGEIIRWYGTVEEVAPPARIPPSRAKSIRARSARN